MTYPDLYKIDLELTRKLLRSYFTLLWDKQRPGLHAEGPVFRRLKFVVAEGRHRETAWFNLRMSDHCAAEQIQPVFSFSLRRHLKPADEWTPDTLEDRDRTDQFFLHHPQAVIWLRKELANFMQNATPMLQPFPEILDTIHRKARTAVALTKRVLLQHTPEYWLTVM
jgi:hypothetical protein